MKLSSAHKKRLTNVARFAAAGAMVVSSLSVAVVSPANAAPTTVNSTVISDSRTGNVGTTYTINFTPNTSSTTQIEEVGVKFCTNAVGWDACVAPTGLNVPSDLTGASATGFVGTAPTFSQQSTNGLSVSFTTDADPETINQKTITLTGLITNPTTPGTYYTLIRTYGTGAVELDNGVSAFAVVNRVIVSGRVAESMSFTVAGVTQNGACGAGELASVTSTNTAIPFGNFTADTPSIACQTVAVATNAVGGYTVGVKHTLAGASPLGGMCRQTATGCTADGVSDAGTIGQNYIADYKLTATPATWDNTVGDSTKGVGLNANGGQVQGFSDGTLYRSMFGASTIQVAGASGPTAATPTTVKLKVDVPATQTAGVYQNSFVYIATPTF